MSSTCRHESLEPFHAISPEQVRSLLHVLGFTRQRPYGDWAEIWSYGSARSQIIVPRTQDAADYATAIRNMFASLAAAGYSLGDMLARIPQADGVVYGLRVSDGDTVTGTIRLSRVQPILLGLQKIVQHTAIVLFEVDLKELDAPPRSKATEIAEGCRLAQTSVGSFVIRMLCPPSRVSHGHQTLRVSDLIANHISANIRYASQWLVEGNLENRPHTLTLGVAEAMCSLRSGDMFGSGDLEISLPQAAGLGKLVRRKHDLSDSVYDGARSLVNHLQSLEADDPIEVEGYVDEVKRIRDGDAESYRIVLRIVNPALGRLLRIPVSVSEASAASDWFARKQRVRVVGSADKSSRNWTLVTRREMVALDDGQILMF